MFSLPIASLIFLVGVASQSSSVSAKTHFVGVYFVVEPQVLRNYVDNLGYDEDTARKTLEGDIDYVIYQINLLFKSLQRFNLDVQIRAERVDILKEEEIFDDCKLLRGKKILADLSLEIFKEWLGNYRHQMTYDMAFLWTGHDVVSGNAKKEAVGYSTQGGMCKSLKNVGIAEFLGDYSAVITTAHEIAHSFGAIHDDECPDETDFIMTSDPKARSPHRWDFSHCTSTAIAEHIEYLNKSGKNCLHNTTDAAHFDMSSQQNRDILNADKICQRAFQYKHAYFFNEPALYQNPTGVVQGDEVCQYLTCAKDDSLDYVPIAPSEGLVCDIGKRCSKGRCVKAPSSFSTPADLKKDCLYGDVRIVSKAKDTCSSAILKYGIRQCYSELKHQCCVTCPKTKFSIPGCEYGDRVPQCKSESTDLNEVCPNNMKYCCYTCRNFLRKRSLAHLALPSFNITSDMEEMLLEPEARDEIGPNPDIDPQEPIYME